MQQSNLSSSVVDAPFAAEWGDRLKPELGLDMAASCQRSIVPSAGVLKGYFDASGKGGGLDPGCANLVPAAVGRRTGGFEMHRPEPLESDGPAWAVSLWAVG